MDQIGRMPFYSPGMTGMTGAGFTAGVSMTAGVQIPGMPQAPVAYMCGWEMLGNASWAMYGGFFGGQTGIFQEMNFNMGIEWSGMCLDMYSQAIEMALANSIQQSIRQNYMNMMMQTQMSMMMDRLNFLESMLKTNAAGTEKYMELLQKMMEQQTDALPKPSPTPEEVTPETPETPVPTIEDPLDALPKPSPKPKVVTPETPETPVPTTEKTPAAPAIEETVPLIPKNYETYRAEMTQKRALELIRDNFTRHIDTAAHGGNDDHLISIRDLETVRNNFKNNNDPSLRELAAACDYILTTGGGMLFDIMKKIETNGNDGYISDTEINYYINNIMRSTETPESKTFDEYKNTMTTEKALELIHNYFPLIEVADNPWYYGGEFNFKSSDGQMSLGDLRKIVERCKNDQDPSFRELAAACDYIANTVMGQNIFNEIKRNNRFLRRENLDDYIKMQNEAR